MTDSTDNALKPCPFCGGVGHMAKDPDMNWGDFYSIKCGACRAKSPEFHASETCPVFFAQVRDAWNRRADLAPDPMGAVKVKPLEWDGAGDRLSASAFGLSLAYRITGKPGDWTLMKTGATSYIHEEGFEAQKAAKAAAQADYETRIRSALEPCDPLADPRVNALVGAARDVAYDPAYMAMEDGDGEPCNLIGSLQAALAAFDTTDTGGKADG